MTVPRQSRWIDEFDRCCDTMIRLTNARNHGEANVSEFNAQIALMWRILQQAPQDMFWDCRDTIYVLIGDYYPVKT
jgi:hypothetical protein